MNKTQQQLNIAYNKLLIKSNKIFKSVTFYRCFRSKQFRLVFLESASWGTWCGRLLLFNRGGSWRRCLKGGRWRNRMLWLWWGLLLWFWWSALLLWFSRDIWIYEKYLKEKYTWKKFGKKFLTFSSSSTDFILQNDLEADRYKVRFKIILVKKLHVSLCKTIWKAYFVIWGSCDGPCENICENMWKKIKNI